MIVENGVGGAPLHSRHHARRSPWRPGRTCDVGAGILGRVIAANVTEAPAGDYRPATITMTGPIVTRGMQYVMTAIWLANGSSRGTSSTSTARAMAARLPHR